jgi:formylglycine-generating enzyme required for sulfatase activity
MNTNVFKGFFLGLCLMFTQACVNESYENCPTDVGNDEPKQVLFGSAKTMTRTAFAGNQWIKGDSIGIYMMEHNAGIANNMAENRHYVADEDGASHVKFNPFTDNQALYYPANPVDFIAYYPYRSTGTGSNNINSGFLYPINIVSQKDTALIDVLYSNDATSKTVPAVVTDRVELTFKHTMARLVFNLRGENDIVIPGTKATIFGMPSTTVLKLADGTLTNTDNITFFDAIGIDSGMVYNNVDYDTTYQAIVIPHARSASPAEDVVQFHTGGGRQFTWKITDLTDLSNPSKNPTDEFVGGNTYTFWLKLVGEKVVLIEGTISPWEVIDYPEVSPPHDLAGTPSKIIIQNGIDTMDVVYIPKGAFVMGDASIANATPHNVSIGHGFRMGTTPVTIKQFIKFLTAIDAVVTNQRITADLTSFNIPGTGANTDLGYCGTNTDRAVNYNSSTKVWSSYNGDENRPMFHITWKAAKAYAIWAGGDLPTEAQWEYAARATIDVSKSYIDGTTDGATMAGYAWYGKASGSLPVSIYTGSTTTYARTASTWGLIDLFGNVAEWLEDAIDTSQDYDSSLPDTDPVDNSGSTHGLRGGANGYTSTIGELKIGARTQGITQSQNWYGVRVVFK